MSAVTRADQPRPPVVGMVGAGQLARMSAQAAIGLGIGFRVLAGAPGDSAAQVCAGTVVGDYRSDRDLAGFAAGCDVVTFDHEHVPAAGLAALAGAAQLRPAPAALRFAQDKLAMRERLAALGVPCPRHRPVRTVAEVTEFAGQAGGWPVVLKAVSGGYDGKGVWFCDGTAAAGEVLGRGVAVIAEEYVAFERELAVLVARSPANQGAAYPVVRTVQRDGVCREVTAPAPDLDRDLAERAQRLALTVARELDVTGLLAVEMFQVGGRVLVNELAMRPHNCGHWTIDAAVTSQFEQHLRAVLNLPLGSPAMTARAAVMVNVLGHDDVGPHQRLAHVLAADPAARVHLYGKPVRPGRKIGHVTVAGDAAPAQLRERAWRAASYLSTGREELPR